MDDPEVDFSSDRDQWHIWLPFVLQADGSEFFQWSRARHMCAIAERTLRDGFFKSESLPPSEEAQLLQTLSELLEHWARRDGFAQPRGDWEAVQALLCRARPLVEDWLY